MNRNVLKITAAFLLVIIALYVYDVFRAKGFVIEVVKIEPQPAPADGHTPVVLKVRVTTRGGEVAKGHDLYAVSLGGGNLKANRVRTDTKGNAEFIYYPYLSSPMLPAGDVPIKIIDESNSVFFEVNASTVVTVHLKEPEKADQTEDSSEFTLEDIFGE